MSLLFFLAVNSLHLPPQQGEAQISTPECPSIQVPLVLARHLQGVDPHHQLITGPREHPTHTGLEAHLARAPLDVIELDHNLLLDHAHVHRLEDAVVEEIALQEMGVGDVEEA